ncbi:MAG: M20/M25/M40 family metallo-hydrolase [Legionella sp.]|jgi:glutamate carboxypeptidase
MKPIISSLFGLLFLCTSLFAQELSGKEQNIIQYVDKHQKNQLTLLKQLVNINSGTNNIAGVRAVGKKIEPIFKQLGFKTRWVEEPKSMHRAATFIAERTGTQGKRLLLIGHLDTVFTKNSAFQKFTRHENTATGPGIIDDKGGDVVIVYALKALHAEHALDNTNITVVLTGDEEDSGKPTSISRKPLFEVAKKSDIALDFEIDISQDTVTVGRRGVSMWKLQTKGIESHSALIFKPGVGYGAIFELSRILNNFREDFEHDKNISLNVGLISGGTKVDYDKNKNQSKAFGKENVIPNTALAAGDFRFTSAAEEAEIMQKMQIIVQKHLPSTKAEITFQSGIPAMTPTQANLDLLKQYSSVSQALGYGEVKPLPANLRGAGDISHIANIVPANLAGLGPLGNGVHSEQETLEIPSLTMQTKRAALFIYRLTR